MIEKLEIKKFDNQRWIINTPEGRNVLVNESAVNLIFILRDSDNQKDAIEMFANKFHREITKQEFEILVQNTFKGLNILSSEENLLYKKSSYLTLKIPLISARVAGLLAKPFSILFKPPLFWPLLIGTFILNFIAAIISFRNDSLDISSLNVVLLGILVGASMIVHELGHIAACRQFGIRHGAIGFGFYFIFPVVYADITQVWNTAKVQRIIANAGGIYLELIYATTLLLVFTIANETTFLLAGVSVFVKTITELNPFIRYDGYWLLSDITNTPNLQRKSNDALKNAFSILFGNLKKMKIMKRDLSRKRVLLMLYGLMNTSLLITYFIYVLFKYSDGIIHFSASLLVILREALAMQFSFQDLPEGFLWILGFHILLIKIILGFSYRMIKRRLQMVPNRAY